MSSFVCLLHRSLCAFDFPFCAFDKKKGGGVREKAGGASHRLSTPTFAHTFLIFSTYWKLFTPCLLILRKEQAYMVFFQYALRIANISWGRLTCWLNLLLLMPLWSVASLGVCCSHITIAAPYPYKCGCGALLLVGFIDIQVTHKHWWHFKNRLVKCESRSTFGTCTTGFTQD